MHKNSFLCSVKKQLEQYLWYSIFSIKLSAESKHEKLSYLMQYKHLDFEKQ